MLQAPHEAELNERTRSLPREIRLIITAHLLDDARWDTRKALLRVKETNTAARAAFTRKLNKIGAHEQALWMHARTPVTISGITYASSKPANKEDKQLLKNLKREREEAEQLSYRAVEAECLANHDFENAKKFYGVCTELNVVLSRERTIAAATPEEALASLHPK
jgi:hypothetical protein